MCIAFCNVIECHRFADARSRYLLILLACVVLDLRSLIRASARRVTPTAGTRPRRRSRKNDSFRHSRPKNLRAPTFSISRRRAARSPIATACRSRKTNSATISRSIFRRRSIFPMRRRSLLRGKKSRAAEKLIGRQIKISDEAILRHYHNRGILPFEIAQNLSQSEYEDDASDSLPAGMTLRPIYVRTYPNGKIGRADHRLHRKDRPQSRRHHR